MEKLDLGKTSTLTALGKVIESNLNKDHDKVCICRKK